MKKVHDEASLWLRIERGVEAPISIGAHCQPDVRRNSRIICDDMFDKVEKTALQVGDPHDVLVAGAQAPNCCSSQDAAGPGGASRR